MRRFMSVAVGGWQALPGGKSRKNSAPGIAGLRMPLCDCRMGVSSQPTACCGHNLLLNQRKPAFVHKGKIEMPATVNLAFDKGIAIAG
ncbi:MAG: hypothetical protein H6577_04145 [Lewinellaceae bacterium]|nr:hypothetical protein [Saprospiraceae bacterium]MCB9337296.1 hypothetical protein [Lewinellaceae bacterium]